MARNWTDEQDEIAYDTFAALANDKGVKYATRTMRDIMQMGADFLELDIQAWNDRYMSEH